MRNITPGQAHRLMQETKDYVLLDVRSQGEFDQGHIEGALLIPDTKIAAEAEQTLLDKDAAILVYCRSGYRALGAARALETLGYTNVYNMGGIINWPYGVVR